MINITKMKITEIYFDKLKTTITFYIGQNAQDNFDIIDNANPCDLWFHLADYSSCHVIATMPEDDDIKIDKKVLKQIVNSAALLCRKHTQKIENLQNVKVVYTNIENVEKTEKKGCVQFKDESKLKYVVC